MWRRGIWEWVIWWRIWKKKETADDIEKKEMVEEMVQKEMVEDMDKKEMVEDMKEKGDGGWYRKEEDGEDMRMR